MTADGGKFLRPEKDEVRVIPFFLDIECVPMIRVAP